MSSSEKYKDTGGAIPLIAIAMVAAIPVVGFFMGNPDKEEFAEKVAKNGASSKSRVEFVNNGYSVDTACRLEADSIAEKFVVKAGGKELYIEACVAETTQAIVASGPTISVRG